MKGFIEVKRKDYKDYSFGNCHIKKGGRVVVDVNYISQVRELEETIVEETGKKWKNEEEITGCEICIADGRLIEVEQSYDEVIKLIKEACKSHRSLWGRK